MASEDVTINVKANITGLSSAMASAEKTTSSSMSAITSKVDSASSGISSSMKKMSSETDRGSAALGTLKDHLSIGAAAGVASSAVTALTGGLSSLVSEAAANSDAMQKFSSTMTGAGFGKKEITAARTEMKKYGDETVYDTQTIMNTTAQLAANGVKDYTGLTEAAGNMNAQFGGSADTFKSVAMVMTQTAGAGKLTTENWNQLTDAIPGASGVLQKAMLKNGAYTGDFRDAMAKGEITAGEFNKAISQTGMTKAAKDAAKSSSTFEGAMGNMQASVQNSIMKIINTIGKKNITDGITKAGDAINAVANTLNKVIGFIEKHQTVFKVLAALLGAVAVVFGTISVATAIATAAMTAFDVVAAINPMTWIALAVVAIVLLIAMFPKILPAIISFGKSAIKWMAGFLSGLWSSISSWFSSVMTSVGSFFSGIGSGISTFVGNAGSIISSFISGVIAWFKALPGNIWNAIKGIGSKLESVFSGIGSFVGNVVNGVVSWFVKLPGRIWNGIKNIGGLIGKAFSVIAGTIGGFVGGIGKAAGNIVSAIGDAFGSIVDVGANLIKGLWKGISGAWTWIKKKLSSFGGWVVKLFKKIFGIHSPSRVMAGLGDYMSQGFANGISGGLGYVQNSVKAMSDVVTGGISSPEIGINSTSASNQAKTESGSGFYVHNEIVGPKINTMIKTYNANDARNGKFAL